MATGVIPPSPASPLDTAVAAIRSWSLRHTGPLPSERALAKTLNVSRVTVRSALQRLTREGLLAQPTPSGRRQVAAKKPKLLAHTVAVLSEARPVDRAAALLSGWDTFTLRHASRTFEANRYHVLNLNLERITEGGLSELLAQPPAGVLAAHDVCENPLAVEALHQLAGVGVAVVASRDLPALGAFDRVEADHEQGAYDLTKWLIDRGRRRILRLWRFPQTHQWLRDRDRGYERAMTEAGLPILSAVRTGEFTSYTGGRADFRHMVRTLGGYLLEHLTGPNRVDAVMVATDPHAYQVAAACRLFGLVPNKDVWIAGFDNTWQSEIAADFEPVGPLVTADKQNDVVGRLLARMLIDRVTGKLPAGPQRTRVPVVLVEVPEVASGVPADKVAVPRSLVGPAGSTDPPPSPSG